MTDHEPHAEPEPPDQQSGSVPAGTSASASARHAQPELPEQGAGSAPSAVSGRHAQQQSPEQESGSALSGESVSEPQTDAEPPDQRSGAAPSAASAPEPPPYASAVLGDPVDPRLVRFVELLVTAGVDRGLLGPREVERIWERHVLNCAVVERLVPSGSRVADLGSGAGLPGIVLALLRPDLHITLIEPLLRRATFLGEVVDELGLGEQIGIERTRAEEYRGPTFSVVTARAVAPLDRLAGLAFGMLDDRGTLLAMKGQRAHDEVRDHTRQLTRLGASWIDVVQLGADVLPEPTTVVVVQVRRRPGR